MFLNIKSVEDNSHNRLIVPLLTNCSTSHLMACNVELCNLSVAQISCLLASFRKEASKQFICCCEKVQRTLYFFSFIANLITYLVVILCVKLNPIQWVV